MTIQAVFFDMGGTIETFRYSRESRLRATPGLRQRLLSAGIDLPWTDEQLYEVVAGGLERYHQRSLASLDELPPARVWREYVFADHPVDPLRLEAAGEDLMLYVETRFYERAMRPESPEVLEAIRRMGLKIGLISNVCSRGQVPTCLNEYGLQGFFDPIVLSSEYGRRKPDPSIFHYAARLAEAPTSACAYVGDRISRDIKGSQAAGYGLSIQIRHDFRHNEDEQGPAPDETIDSLSELAEILRREQSPQAARSRPRLDPSLRVRALLFDAGDILYRRPDKGRCLAEFLTARGLNVKDVPVEVVRSLREGAYRGELGPGAVPTCAPGAVRRDRLCGGRAGNAAPSSRTISRCPSSKAWPRRSSASRRVGTSWGSSPTRRCLFTPSWPGSPAPASATSGTASSPPGS